MEYGLYHTQTQVIVSAACMNFRHHNLFDDFYVYFCKLWVYHSSNIFCFNHVFLFLFLPIGMYVF